jgi:NAD(P)-dependent dehydrogenase (short-subunit alcohol dehydrogenase family)
MYTYVKNRINVLRVMKNIFITGVSSGIGKDAVRYLIEKGFQVHGSVRKKEDADQIVALYGNNFSPYIFDVKDKEAIYHVRDKLKDRLPDGHLDVLVNNAGVAIPGPLYHVSDEDFENQIQINLFGVRTVTNAFLPLLGYGDFSKQNPGKIINISSVSGLFTTPFNGAYCISKHALECMNDVYRRELLPFGIDVVAIEPGPIKSDIWKKNLGVMEKYKHSPYKHILAKADKMIENAEKSAMPVEAISKKIFSIIQDRKPSTRNVIHRKKWLFLFLSKFVPDRMADRLIWKNFNKNTYRPV